MSKDIAEKPYSDITLNADELLKELRKEPLRPFSAFNLPVPDAKLFTEFFAKHPLSEKKGLGAVFSKVRVTNGAADFSGVPFFPESVSELHPDFVGNYLAAIFADWLRQALIDSRQSFSFETVMSGPDKVQLLEKAQQAGYRTYLYFVTTSDVKINIGRVRFRVTQGGHDVPEKDIVNRYTKTMHHLRGALKCSYRAYLFDNSAEGQQPVFIAELVPEGEMIYRTEILPAWYEQYVEGEQPETKS